MNLTAAKYFKILEIEWELLKEYKLEFILKLLRIPIHVAILVLVWLTVFEKSGATILAGMTLPFFITYIIVARLIAYCHKPWDIYDILFDYIHTGKIALFLTKPVRFSFFFFCKAMADSFFSFITIVLLLVAGNILTFFGIPYTFPNITYFLLFLTSFLLALVLGFTIYYSIALTMFWVGDVWSVWGTIDGIQAIFSGEIIPLTISTLFYTLSLALPFRHLVFTPVFIYLQQFTIREALVHITIQLGWILAFAIIASIILKKGLSKTDSQGG